MRNKIQTTNINDADDNLNDNDVDNDDDNINANVNNNKDDINNDDNNCIAIATIRISIAGLKKTKRDNLLLLSSDIISI